MSRLFKCGKLEDPIFLTWVGDIFQCCLWGRVYISNLKNILSLRWNCLEKVGGRGFLGEFSWVLTWNIVKLNYMLLLQEIMMGKVGSFICFLCFTCSSILKGPSHSSSLLAFLYYCRIEMHVIFRPVRSSSRWSMTYFIQNFNYPNLCLSHMVQIIKV